MYDFTTTEPFWSKVNVPEDRNPNVCWEWTGALGAYGYGAIYQKRKCYGVHRISYIIHFGEIPAGLCVCHACDNPKCVNPNHLWLGTKGDNNRDAWKKGRNHPKRGKRNKATKENP